MSDTVNFDTQEKVDILIKSAFGFPSAEESRQWYEEVAVPYNNYVIGDDVFLDEVPAIPDFDTNGTVKSASDVGLETSDFENYSVDTNSKSTCSIVDDSTGVIRRFQLLILDQTPNLATAGSSWYKLNSSSVNLIKNSFQFNHNKYTDNYGNVQQPYLYRLNTQDEVDTDLTLPMGKKGGNWFIDLKSGVLFFPDFGNFSNGTQTTAKHQVNTTGNKPVLSIYAYIGRIGASKLLTVGSDESNVSSPVTKQIFINTTDNTILRYDGSSWVSLGKGVDVDEDLSLNAGLKVGGDASFNGVVEFASDVSFNSNNLRFPNGSISASAISGSISTTGTSTSESTAISQTLDVSGSVIFDSSLDISGASTMKSTLNVSKAATLSSTLNVTGASTLSSTLAVTNAATMKSTLNVSKAATLSSTLEVSGAATFNSNLTVNGKINGATIISDDTLINLIIGNGTIGDPAPDGSNNVGFGYNVLKNIITGDNNIAM